MGGFIAIFIILIICVTILAGIYLYCCSENKIGIFDYREYRSDIKELKKYISELTKEIQEMKK